MAAVVAHTQAAIRERETSFSVPRKSNDALADLLCLWHYLLTLIHSFVFLGTEEANVAPTKGAQNLRSAAQIGAPATEEEGDVPWRVATNQRSHRQSFA